MEAATQMLKRAVELDTQQKFCEAKVCYEEGIELLIKAVKDLKDESKKGQIRSKISSYMNRAEELKDIIQNDRKLWKVAEKIEIKENQRGFSYSTLFSKYINDKLKSVRIEDPYIRRQHQIFNLLRLCELLVKTAKSLKKIHVLTSRAGHENAEQGELFSKIKSSLGNFGIELIIEYSETLHDREIQLDNGWVVKIGRGLDFFKGQEKMTVGFCDYDLRECLETTIEVYDTRCIT